MDKGFIYIFFSLSSLQTDVHLILRRDTQLTLSFFLVRRPLHRVFFIFVTVENHLETYFFRVNRPVCNLPLPYCFCRFKDVLLHPP